MSAMYPIRGQSRTPAVEVGLDIGTATTQGLTTAYTYGSAGIAFASQFQAITSANLTDVWVAVNGFGGTWGSTDGVINFEIREGSVANNQPGTTVTGSGTIALAGTESSAWVKSTGHTIALVAGKLYWICIGDADGGGTNYVTLLRDVRNTGTGPLYSGCSTTDGWATAGTGISYGVGVAFNTGGIIQIGSLGVATAALASNVRPRGSKFTPSERCTLVGMRISQSTGTTWSTAGWTLKVFEDGIAPSGTALKTIVQTSQAATPRSVAPLFWMFAPADHVNLAKGRTYRIVWVPAANSTYPYKCTSYASLDAYLRHGFSGGCGTLLHTIDDGADGWTDDADACSNVPLVIMPAPFPTVVG